MGDLSPNFSRSEFACHDGCGKDTIDFETLIVLEEIRAHFGASVHINSGFRCAKYNARIKGAKDSQHLRGRAADFTVVGFTPAQVQEYVYYKYAGKYGIGCYKTFTHIDTRTNGPSRWNG